ncbi:hypothetical protein IYQ_16794 [Aeromonas salmonicida subsp. salmonicida 01-B526]|uniref:Uncharacterized protein n=1 Tax=Aeromonas salmonicida subsp. salmonicida 01-B526 TaxID=1076135 RepID=A0ABN0DXF2_AERSS|nr:hypothetical protein IYQ_16794 [Aeromonas salmonicida subsp. salmonicida 01-B526]
MSDELFAQHGRLIRQRWPTLWPRLLAQDVESIQAELQAASLPEVAVLHLYGTGLGDLPRALLGRSSLKRLEVKIMNGALFALVLRLLDQQDWLADSKVELMMAGDESEIRPPFFALPPELQLVEDAAARIRDRLVSEIDLPFASARFDAEHPAVTRRLATSLICRSGRQCWRIRARVWRTPSPVRLRLRGNSRVNKRCNCSPSCP